MIKSILGLEALPSQTEYPHHLLSLVCNTDNAWIFEIIHSHSENKCNAYCELYLSFSRLSLLCQNNRDQHLLNISLTDLCGDGCLKK